MTGRALIEVTDAGRAPIIAIGRELDPAAPVQWVREDGPCAGRAAGIAAAVCALDHETDGDAPEWMLVFAGGQPHADRVSASPTAAAAVVEPARDGKES